MKEELQSKLVEILTSLQTTVGKASDFAMAELPDIAQSYIAYGRVASIVNILFGVVILAAAVWGAYQIYAANKSAEEYGEPIALNVFGGIGAVLAGVIGFVQIGSHLNIAMLVWFAPKVWLLKEIAGMLR